MAGCPRPCPPVPSNLLLHSTRTQLVPEAMCMGVSWRAASCVGVHGGVPRWKPLSLPRDTSKGHLGMRKRKNKGWEQGDPTASLREPGLVSPPGPAQTCSVPVCSGVSWVPGLCPDSRYDTAVLGASCVLATLHHALKASKRPAWCCCLYPEFKANQELCKDRGRIHRPGV